MKKLKFVVLATRQFTIAGIVKIIIAEMQGKEAELVMIQPGNSKNRFDIDKLYREHSEKNTEIIILGHICGDPVNRIAVENGRTLVDQILFDAKLLYDPAFAEYRSLSEAIVSPWTTQVTFTLEQISSAFESPSGDSVKACEKISRILKKGYEPNLKIANFIKNPVFQENIVWKTLKYDATFLERPVVVGVLSLKTEDKTGISMRAVIKHALVNKKPLDLMVVNDGKSLEIFYQPSFQPAMEVVKSHLISSGFEYKSPKNQNTHFGLWFAIPKGSNAPSNEQVFSLVNKAIENAEKFVMRTEKV